MVSIRQEIENALDDRREAERRTGYRSQRNGVALELAKIIIPALLAVGGSWLAMDHRLSALEGQVLALTTSLQEVKTMLGIGVYRGSDPR